MKAIKTRHLVILTLAFSSVVSAQQLPQFTQYMYNTISVNPAYAGSRGTLNLTALHRNQWAGLEGNPRTTTVSVHAPLRDQRIGLGISYINDHLGYESSNYVYGDFSYSLLFSEESRLSFGLKAGFTNYQLENPDVNDPFFDSEFNNWSPNIGAGVYYTTKRWYLGFSSPRMLTTDLNKGEFQALERNSYYAIGGFVVDLSPNIKFKPTMITKFTNGAPSTFDVTANFLFLEKLWLGVSYRFNDSDNFGAIVDFQVSKDIRLGYSYDIPRGDLKPYSNGTHEIILIYELAFKKKGPAKSPRYF